jgi:signal transduction histidine kinase
MKLVNITAFGTLVIGYLLAILLATPLTLGNFLAFTALQLLYCAAFWLLLRGYKTDLRFSLPVYALILSALTVSSGLLSRTGIDWDWLIYMVTASIFFSLFSARPAITAALLLYGAIILNLAFLDDWRWSLNLLASLANLLAALSFVSGFSLLMNLLLAQKERAERLLQEVELSRGQLEAAHAQLRSYSTQVEELTIARERTRVAREIHDTLGHYLTILNVQLETISKLVKRDPSRLEAEIAEARHVAAQSMQEVRNAVATLRPAGIATLTLAQALTQLGNEFKHAAPGTALTLDLEAELPPLSPDVQLTLYRAAQEALTNVRKHAQASKALVRLRYEDGWLELLALDNGRGPLAVPDNAGDAEQGSAAQKSGGFGLPGLCERVELLGGQVTYGPATPAGYRVTVRIQVLSTQSANTSARLESMQGARG